jgi:hypothetical protein
MLWQGAKWRILKNFNVQNEECHNYDIFQLAQGHHTFELRPTTCTSTTIINVMWDLDL